MREVFRRSQPFLVPDGTLLSPFLSPLDSESGLPGEVATALSEVSIAEGLLPSATKSRIQFHPHTCLITFVLDGELTVRMQGPRDDYRTPLLLSPGEAVITERGSYLQLINDSSTECRVLYIVTPAYVFLLEGDVVEYDDAVVLDDGWDALRERDWRPEVPVPSSHERTRARDEVLRRVAQNSPNG